MLQLWQSIDFWTSELDSKQVQTPLVRSHNWPKLNRSFPIRSTNRLSKHPTMRCIFLARMKKNTSLVTLYAIIPTD
jgi:hypothetical protein